MVPDSRQRVSRFRFLPEGATADTGVILSARALRGLGDGFVSVLLPVRLAQLGFSESAVGTIASATLFGSAMATLAAGLLASRLGVKRILIAASLVMMATGLGFASVTEFWFLLAIAFIGTLNPTAGDVSVFLPVEQAMLPSTAPASVRTAIFARYRMVGSLAAAAGALLAGLPTWLEGPLGVSQTTLVAAMFVVYAALGAVVLINYRRLSVAHAQPTKAAPLRESKGIVYRLTALFALDSFASGFVVQSLLALWLNQRFGFSVATTGLIFFWLGLLTAISQLLAAPLAARFGLVNVMVFTHLPANIFLMLAPFMPSATLALLMLTLRSLLQAMDAPARSSYVMAVVPEHERAAASSVTNAPRGLATAFSPAIAGWLLSLSTFGLPLVIGGGLKAIYDLVLWRQFRTLKPPEET
jgi:MFS family permease